MPLRALLLVFVAACGAMYAEPGPPPPTDAAASWQRLTVSRDLDGAVVGDAPGQATIAMVFASWCGYCRAEVGELEALLARRGDVRVVGVNFRHHEEYDRRGDSEAVRGFVRDHAPWMRVVPGDRALWRAFGSPTYVPTLYVFDAQGQLAASYDRGDRFPPDAAELEGVLGQLAAARR